MNDIDPQVSVLVPTYNDGVLLEDALESIRRQTHDDIEVIVSDDAGAEPVADRIKKEFASDRRFRFTRNMRNLGMTGNWNEALRQARGQWVAKLDGDDAWKPEVLDRLLQACQRNDAEIAFCRTMYCGDDLATKGEYRGESWMRKNGIDPGKEHVRNGYFWYKLSFDDRQLWHSNAFLLKRSLLLHINGWDERWGCASDSDLILRLLELDEKVVHCPYRGVMYRGRSGSVSDLFRRNAWLRRESAAIHLLSLERQYRRGAHLRGHLKIQWQRYWKIWQGSDRGTYSTVEDLPSVYGLRMNPPPFRVRIQSEMWDLMATVKRRLLNRRAALI